ncbi:MAG: 16S rRNA (guanine(527)-N(7))-methyltransferase RsmG [Candidatus Faecousia sp.]|nr:16S rRNA (guanine(527)-N(7))-methyltransferase RsmG [Candidatus Faecousia sp.]
MDKMMQTLLEGARELDIPLPGGSADTLCAFAQAMLRQNEVMNLTAITEPEKVARLHLLDSLTVTKALEPGKHTLIDVGCGAGFPGVPLAAACKDLKVTLLDSLGKRVKWLEETLPGLGIPAECVNARAEDFAAQRRERYDYAVSRAVARLNILLELTAPFVKVGGAVLALKGAAAEEELQEAAGAMKKLGLKPERVLEFPIEDTHHRLIVLRKVAPTPKQYPRRYAKIKQSPL